MARLSRVEIGAALRSLQTGVKTYFQPPTGKSIVYPCFIYSRNAGMNRKANDHLYLRSELYDVLYITTDPDTDMPTRMLEKFAYCSDGKPYVKDNLYHYPFTIHNL